MCSILLTPMTTSVDVKSHWNCRISGTSAGDGLVNSDQSCSWEQVKIAR